MAAALLERLPVEILVKVLGKLSATDIYSTISASPGSLRVFESNKSHILEAVACDGILSEENLRLALAACAIPAVWPLPEGPSQTDDDMEMSPSEQDYKELEERFKIYRDGPGLALSVAATWVQVIKLCRTVDHVLTEYARTALSTLASALVAAPPTLPLGCVQLSATERTRFQRAFFRFELCRRTMIAEMRAFRWPSGDLNAVFVQVFLDPLQLAEWEKEELSCIHAFVQRQYSLALTDIETEFTTSMDGYLVAKASFAPVRPGHPYAVGGLRFSGLPQDLAKFRLSSLGDVTSYQQDQVDFMTILGLPFLHHFARTTGREKAAMMAQFASRRGPGLGLDVFQSHLFDRGSFQEIGGWYDRTDRPNAGWLWAKNKRPANWQVGTEHGVGEFGLVFWDLQRLAAMGLFKNDISLINLLAPRSPDLADIGSSEWVRWRFRKVMIEEEWLEALRPDKFLHEDERRLLQRLDY